MEITKELLLHWWHYYGKCFYTLEELEQFNKIIEKYGTEKVFDAVIASIICENGSPTPLLLAIRKNVVDDFFKSIPTVSDFTDEENAELTKLRQSVLQTLNDTYNK